MHGEPEADDSADEHLIELASALARGARIVPELCVKFDVRKLLSAATRSVRGACVSIDAALRAQRAISPAARWVLDNLHVVEAQLAELPRVLGERQCRELPRDEHSGASVPRIYRIAQQYLLHCENRCDIASLRSFIGAYQRSSRLQINELWSLPFCLRLALVVHLGELATRTRDALHARINADALADRYLEASATNPMLNLRAAVPPATGRGAFLVQLAGRFRLGPPRALRAMEALNQMLAEEGSTLDALVHEEYRRQSANNVEAGNIIGSLRDIGATDWREFFERVSTTDASLRKIKSYADTDFLTRDRYRGIIERLARRSRLTETDVVNALHSVVAHADADSLEFEVGHHLIGEGFTAFENQLGVRPLLWERVRRRTTTVAVPAYLLAAGMLTLLVLVLVSWLSRLVPSMGGSLLVWVVLGAAVFPCSELALQLLQRALSGCFPARRLPRLEFREGIPKQWRTLVAVPVMVGNEESVREHLRQLEVHAIANSDDEIRFALLSDWPDAQHEHLPGDAGMLDALRQGIEKLNARYPTNDETEQRFYLLHRRRVWNESENCWMGWERKRGKLTELNQLLCGEPTTFLPEKSLIVTAPQGIRFVVTLDADTRLPIGAVTRLVGIAAHPLHRPCFDADGRRVIAGYGIIQPRIVPLLARQGERSLYRDAISGTSGMDPYAGAISDLYQDVFDEGSYTGKGLYDVKAFHRAMQGRVPPDTLLSHDLLEGLYVRCALASDLVCYEDFPSHSEVDAARLHRWTRGDWQLLPWIFGRRGADIPMLGKWKMLDNLRRSLLGPAAVIMLTLACAMPQTRLFWLFALIVVQGTVPLLLATVARLVLTTMAPTGSVQIRRELTGWISATANGFLNLAFLAQQSWLMMDAIVRALLRQFVTHRQMLQWMTAAQAKSLGRSRLSAFTWSLKGSTAVVLFSAAVVMASNPMGLRRAAPLLLLWWLTPLLAQRLSLSRDRKVPEQYRAAASPLRLIARKTWRFFTTFVSSADHFLPPDNMQETPSEVVAHRTSPTNIGLYLLSCASAYDMGWIGLHDVSERLRDTVGSMLQLERERGHFFNWYDTLSMRPLEPRYVSTVDSGNLCGHLMALVQWCRWARRRDPRMLSCAAGVHDTLLLMRVELERLSPSIRASTVSIDEISIALRDIDDVLQESLSGYGALVASWSGIEAQSCRLLELVEALAVDDAQGAAELLYWATAFTETLRSHLRDAGTSGHQQTLDRLKYVEGECEALIDQMDFGFLFDSHRRLFSIGWQSSQGVRDSSHYDLLASEARLASFVAIAKGDVEARHWSHLGRRLTGSASSPVLLSWSGSMFEYLMPALVMNEPARSVLDVSARNAIKAQREAARIDRVPWGSSEAAYNVRDIHFTYQYAPFGIATLGLQRDLDRNLVIAPYATALAAMYRPVAARENFTALAALGAAGRFGFHESIDFTPEHLPKGVRHEVVRAFMAHHQAMTLIALANAVSGGERTISGHPIGMRRHFHADLRVRAAELLLEERAVSPRPQSSRLMRRLQPPRISTELPQLERTVGDVQGAVPVVQLLSNSRFATMLTASGAGYSASRELSVTRWHADTTRDACGSWIYLRDIRNGEFWSAGFQPTRVVADSYVAHFSDERATIERSDGVIRCCMDVLVATDDNAELRRITLHNDGDAVREVELTSYCEVVLTSAASDAAHRVFSNMFVYTEWVSDHRGTLLAHRRPRTAQENPVWAGHVIAASSGILDSLQFETDRARFIGRNRDCAAPAAVVQDQPLSNSCGAVLDPIFSLRVRVQIAPKAQIRVLFTTFVADSRGDALQIADKYHHADAFERGAQQAWTYARADLHHLEIDIAEAHAFQAFAAHLLYPNSRHRADRGVLAANDASVSELWRFGVSGDRPVVVVRCTDLRDMEAAQQILRAQEYWRSKLLVVDVVFLNERAQSYQQELQHALQNLVQSASGWNSALDAALRPVAVAIASTQLDVRDQTLLLTAASVLIVPAQGSLVDQLARQDPPPPSATTNTASALRHERALATPVTHCASASLEFSNGFGGFDNAGLEYSFALRPGLPTPHPWSNVIANADLGTLVTESGAMCTWWQNSSENLLTPWSNDPVTDSSGEVIYLRDEDDATLWTATCAPIRLAAAQYGAVHGQGYSRFRCDTNELFCELTIWVDATASVKWFSLAVTNRSARVRNLAVVAYVEWVLAHSRAQSAPYIVTERDAQSGALLARNPWSRDFSGAVAWLDVHSKPRSFTCAREEFLGRHGSQASPIAMRMNKRLTGRCGAGYDPCAALDVALTLPPGGSQLTVFTLGQAASRSAALEALQAARADDAARSLERVKELWEARLDCVQIKTPDRALDILMNRWFIYQVMSCRLWARAGFYQAGGAFGFRDQLQDILALLVTTPELAREHLLRAAAHQFVEGDVQHWWHPPLNRGVRTRIVDDRVWLPYVLAEYIRVTGDVALLDENVPFLDGMALPADKDDIYFEPTISEHRVSVYEHAARALDASLAHGRHGLPLMGGGDWNDGMNRVGAGGAGESIWMAWFLLDTIKKFTAIALSRGEASRARRWNEAGEGFRNACEQAGWDGAWYRRAFFDDGVPLGSAVNTECRIDSIAQSWAVMCGAAPIERADRAMDSVREFLVRDADDLILLFAPPFNHAPLDPGYIKGYPPGIRENGGQYTHAAIWALIAFAKLGRSNDVGDVLEALNPIRRSETRRGSAAYKVEPYVLAADIYSEAPHARRGGWTWYTGSAGWMYRAVLEWVLGVRILHDSIEFAPCLPASWPTAQVTYKRNQCWYDINMVNDGGGRAVKELWVDEQRVEGTTVSLLRDSQRHSVRLRVG